MYLKRYLFSLIHVHPAVHMDNLPCDVRGAVGDQVFDGVKNIIGRAEAPLRYRLNQSGAVLFGNFACHICFDKARSYGVNRNPPRGDFLGQGLREANHARLACGIVRLPRITRCSNNGTDIDNATPAILRHGLKTGFC